MAVVSEWRCPVVVQDVTEVAEGEETAGGHLEVVMAVAAVGVMAVAVTGEGVYLLYFC